MMYGARWYDREGNELHDIDEVEALLVDIDRRRVAFDDFGFATVSTVLLVLDHSWDDGPPLIFETMTFPEGSWADVQCERTPNEAAALAAHDRACAEVREARRRFDEQIASLRQTREIAAYRVESVDDE